MANATLVRELRAIVRATPWLMDLLALVRRFGPPHSFVAAGAVRDTVWYAERVAKKGWGRRWPELRVLPGEPAL